MVTLKQQTIAIILWFTRYSGNICAVRWKILPPDNFYDR